MAQVTLAQHPTGIQSVPPDQVSALAQQLTQSLSASTSVVTDASEGEGRTLADIVAFLKDGGIWISWGGYPFYYTPSQPGGLGYNFSRFCKLAGVPDPNPQAVGGELFAPPNGFHRALWTPTPNLPKPWVTDPNYPPKMVGNVYVWGAIAVPVGKGWWFYASTDFGPTQASQYGSWIIKTVASSAHRVWLWVIGGVVVAAAIGGVVYVASKKQ